MGELLAETVRLRFLRGLEGMLGSAGYEWIAGVDEAGRGSLAGPVVAAAVIVDPRRVIPGVDDSKQLSRPKRERLEPLIRQTCLASAVARVSPATIDRVNILEATRQAMRQALKALDPLPDLAIVDAVPLRDMPFLCLPVIKGDALSYSVACASILAKVDRDRWMINLDRSYPEYGFSRNMGYGAAAHREALRVHGPSPEHRLTFRSVLPSREEELR